MFNQPLSFDTSSVTDMAYMFYVRALAPNLQPSPSLDAACTSTAPTRPSAGCNLLVGTKQAADPLRVGGLHILQCC